MNSAPDEELMLQVRNGDCEMLGVLFDRYHAPLFNFYARLMDDRGASEDLVQEVFLRILRYRASYQPGTAFRPWIYQIARNARFDHFRKSPPQERFEAGMVPAAAPHDAAQQEQEAELLHRALQQLPEDKREILILARFQELKYEEIAGLLGCELNAVKTRVHRALQDLRKVFRRLEQGIREPGGGSAAADLSLRRSSHEV
ncbi:MAG TPA: RNA polymerase sigma factor [Patescibacteria group bacterium]|nr:RNA polymerase sigma factor [Patescibacteria group bacterium]